MVWVSLLNLDQNPMSCLTEWRPNHNSVHSVRQSHGPSIFVKWIFVKLTVQVWYPSLQQCHQIWYSTLDIWIKEGPVSSKIFNISCFSAYLLFVLSLSKLKMGFSMYWVRVTKSDICCIYCLFEIFHTYLRSRPHACWIFQVLLDLGRGL